MNVTIYFRKAVWEKLQDEPDRSALVNRLLEKHYGGFSEEPVLVAQPPVTTTVPYSAGLVRGADFVPKPPDPETGYPCCLGKRPCKHWQWDGNKSAYINSLTGKERGVAF